MPANHRSTTTFLLVIRLIVFTPVTSDELCSCQTVSVSSCLHLLLPVDVICPLAALLRSALLLLLLLTS